MSIESLKTFTQKVTVRTMYTTITHTGVIASEIKEGVLLLYLGKGQSAGYTIRHVVSWISEME